MNVVSGWFKDEFTKLGEPWLEHGERYRRSEEFICYIREVWTSDHAETNGDFYNLHDFDLRPKPAEVEGRAHPEIFMGGNCPQGVAETISDVSDVAIVHNRTVRFGVNGFMVARDTEAEAHAVLDEIVEKADVEAVDGFASAVTQAGQSTGDRKGMWQDSEFEDLAQYNDGFRTGLIGTPEQVASRIMESKREGVDLMLLGLLHVQEEVEYFVQHVLPLVRELEAAELARV